MALKMLPILYLNLGGEMMYIIDQRLIAQKVPPERASKGTTDLVGICANICFCTMEEVNTFFFIYYFPKVMIDIVSTMFNKKFLLEIFLKNQPVNSTRALRTMFDRLAHASIMRLNSSSMDKVKLPSIQLR